MKRIRRARPEDAQAIHDVHMRSIREVCSQDHTPQEIEAWAGRTYRAAERLNAIHHHHVWVIDSDTGAIEGFGHLALEPRNGELTAYIYGFYFAPEGIGQGFGKQLLDLMIAESRKGGARTLTLESTLTARPFYRKFGFEETGPQITVHIAGEEIRCYPMSLKL